MEGDKKAWVPQSSQGSGLAVASSLNPEPALVPPNVGDRIVISATNWGAHVIDPQYIHGGETIIEVEVKSVKKAVSTVTLE